MSSETLKEYGVHAVSIAVIAYAMVTPVTVSDFWCLGGAAALSLTFEVIRRARPVTPPTVPTTEPLDTARTMLDRSMSAVESLAEHLLRPPELLPPKSAATPKADAEGDGSDENGSDDEHFESQTRGWLVGISRMLAMCMGSYQWPIPVPDLIQLLGQVQEEEWERAKEHAAGSKEHAFHSAQSFA